VATRNIIQAELEANAPPDYISKTYGIHIATVYRYRSNLRLFGEVWPQSGRRRGPSPRLDAEAKEVGESPGFTKYPGSHLSPGNR
jgi:transposase